MKTLPPIMLTYDAFLKRVDAPCESCGADATRWRNGPTGPKVASYQSSTHSPFLDVMLPQCGNCKTTFEFLVEIPNRSVTLP